ncbi:hypothetical protein P2318_17580 [Myxococcaceae bacterium GXIMD 01537]
MKKLLLPFAAALAVFTLVPTPAAALPPDCDQACDCSTPCSNICTIPGGRTRLTCGSWEVDGCIEMCGAARSDEMASKQEKKDAPTEAPVCREPVKDARG